MDWHHLKVTKRSHRGYMPPLSLLLQSVFERYAYPLLCSDLRTRWALYGQYFGWHIGDCNLQWEEKLEVSRAWQLLSDYSYRQQYRWWWWRRRRQQQQQQIFSCLPYYTFSWLWSCSLTDLPRGMALCQNDGLPPPPFQNWPKECCCITLWHRGSWRR